MSDVRAVFVFGSNEAGRHGAGAAAFALRHRGAVWGQGRGRQGQAYAIPTKDGKIRTRGLPDIAADVAIFLRYAAEHHDETFLVTRIGCGLAGYTDADIAPMFQHAPENCILPKGWRACGI